MGFRERSKAPEEAQVVQCLEGHRAQVAVGDGQGAEIEPAQASAPEPPELASGGSPAPLAAPAPAAPRWQPPRCLVLGALGPQCWKAGQGWARHSAELQRPG